MAQELSDLESRIEAQERALAMLLAGQAPTPEMIAEGQFFFDVSGAEALEIVRQKGARWLDVRTDSEVRAGIIPGATWIPMDELEERLDELSQKEPLVVYCAAGGRSASVCGFLAAKGFPRLYNLEGGIGAWQGETAKHPDA